MLQGRDNWIVLIVRGLVEALKAGLMVSVPVFILLTAIDISTLLIYKVSLDEGVGRAVIYDNLFTAAMTFCFAFSVVFVMFVLALFSKNKNSQFY